MVFVDRKAKYPGRWTMKKSDGTSEVVTLVRNDEPEVEGTPMNAETLNTLSDVAGAEIARQQAEAAREAAAGSATEAAGSASAAAESKAAAATSESNAAKHEEAAKKAADEAGAKAGTDKTLSIENAPADAKATGDALAGKVDNDVILDEDGNVIFYSKAAVDTLLAGKLNLTGGTMKNTLLFDIDTDLNPFYANKNVDGDFAIRLHRSKTKADVAFGILGSNIGIWDFVQNQWVINGVLGNKDIYIGGQQCLGFVVASGSNYVRLGDGTQICTTELSIQNIAQGGTYEANNVAFPVPFSDVPIMSTGSSWGWGEDAFFTGISYANFNIRIFNCSSNPHSRHVIAIGRWK